MYSRYFDKKDCELLTTVLDYYLCNSECNDKVSQHVQSLMEEFDSACDTFNRDVTVEVVSDKILKLHFE
jgi:hypothetical protein